VEFAMNSVDEFTYNIVFALFGSALAQIREEESLVGGRQIKQETI
jgi:hypothetical protein